MDNICNSINTLSILKFIIKSINTDTLYIKLIFIGPQIEKTQNILKKIENKDNKKYELYFTLIICFTWIFYCALVKTSSQKESKIAIGI